MTHKLYLFLFLLLFVFITFFLRTYLLWKNTGINAITFDRTDDIHGFNGKIFTAIICFEIIVVGIYTFGGDWYAYLLPFWYLENTTIRSVGWLLLHLSLVWIFIAQLQMASSWRIGIDKKNKTKLVTQNFFSISRNPIFLGILVANLGMFLVLPNAFTLLITVLSTNAVHIHVRLEETFLREIHGIEYLNYCEKVRRWL